MFKHFLAILFSFMFLSLVLAPTLIMAIDDSVDISYVYDISDEEEDKGKETSLEFEKFVVDLDISVNNFLASKSSQDAVYTFKTYPKPHLNLIFSPPEFI